MTPASAHTRAPVVAIDDVTKTVTVGLRRRRVEILKGVDLSVGVNEVIGLLGPNGAGKTTTVKVALGLMRPTSGTVSLAVNGLGDVGYLPENPYFYDYLTGAEFLRFCGRLCGVHGDDLDERVADLLADVGLTQAAKVHLRKYSKGMLQRIGISQALVNDPSLLLLDEPMTGLDPLGRIEVKRIIQRLHERGKTILFNSHILSDVAELCTGIAVMNGGRVVWSGSVQEALGEAKDLEAFFMREVAAS